MTVINPNGACVDHEAEPYLPAVVAAILQGVVGAHRVVDAARFPNVAGMLQALEEAVQAQLARPAGALIPVLDAAPRTGRHDGEEGG